MLGHFKVQAFGCLRMGAAGVKAEEVSFTDVLCFAVAAVLHDFDDEYDYTAISMLRLFFVFRTFGDRNFNSLKETHAK